MKLHDNDKYHENNFEKVKLVGKYLGIETHFLDISSEFKSNVYDYFVDSYKQGITPNPCVICNREIKFGRMVKFADELKIEFVSTGHYVKCDGNAIYMGLDDEKDQSYFLGQISKSVLPRLIFPLGDWQKSAVKEFAQKIEVLKEFATQKESSEICFVDNTYTDILARHMNIDMAGETINTDGVVIGTHSGYMHYTIGKRRGFFVNGAHEPHFVVDIKPETNQIVVGKHEELSITEIVLKDVNLFDEISNKKYLIKARYRTSGVMGSIIIENETIKIILDEPIYGVAKGQMTAIYDGNMLIGSGIIVS
jgi:tRNA-specific 2-thiouridylase